MSSEWDHAADLVVAGFGGNLSESVCFGRLAAEHALGRAVSS